MCESLKLYPNSSACSVHTIGLGAKEGSCRAEAFKFVWPWPILRNTFYFRIYLPFSLFFLSLSLYFSLSFSPKNQTFRKKKKYVRWLYYFLSSLIPSHPFHSISFHSKKYWSLSMNIQWYKTQIQDTFSIEITYMRVTKAANSTSSCLK